MMHFRSSSADSRGSSGAGMALCGKGTGLLYPHDGQSLDIGYPGSAVTVLSTGQ